MDKHTDLLVTFIKRVIFKNLEKINDDNPNYNNIVMGGKILWNDYYKRAELGHETYTITTNRLIKYLENNHNDYINAYIKEFGKFWIYK
jgi:hypothetical protein